MIDYETYCHIRQLADGQGLSVSQIAAQTALDERTVSSWLKQERYRPRRGVRRAGKLDPYKELIAGWLERHPYTAAQILQRLRQNGYTGGYSIVKEHVRKVRPVTNRAYLKLAFAPGECVQVDWGCAGNVRVGFTTRRLSFLCLVLCHSRMLYVEFALSERLESFLHCLQNGLQYFGGCPERLMVDNMKTAVLRHRPGEQAVIHPRLLDMAAHYGFQVTAHAPRRPNQKGRVENAVGYVKKNFLAGLDPAAPGQLNPAARAWLDSVANVRQHGETRRRPVDLFAEEERPRLQPLPATPYEAATIATVRASSQFRVNVDANRYSVPSIYASQRLDLHLYADRVCLYYDGNLVASHRRSYDRGRDFEDPGHVRPLLAQRKKARNQQHLLRFLALGANAETYLHGLQEHRPNYREHIRRILSLIDVYNRDEVVRALDDAMEMHAFSSDYIVNILESRRRHRPEPGPLHLTRREDLLDLELSQPDLSIYHCPGTENQTENNSQ